MVLSSDFKSIFKTHFITKYTFAKKNFVFEFSEVTRPLFSKSLKFVSALFGYYTLLDVFPLIKRINLFSYATY